MKNTTNIILGVIILVIVFGLGMMARNIFSFGSNNSSISAEAATGDNYKTTEQIKPDEFKVSFKNLETVPASGGDKKLHYDIMLETTSQEGTKKLNNESDDVAQIIGSLASTYDPQLLVSGEKLSNFKMMLLTKIMEKYPDVKVKDISITNIVYN